MPTGRRWTLELGADKDGLCRLRPSSEGGADMFSFWAPGRHAEGRYPPVALKKAVLGHSGYRRHPEA